MRRFDQDRHFSSDAEPAQGGNSARDNLADATEETQRRTFIAAAPFVDY